MSDKIRKKYAHDLTLLHSTLDRLKIIGNLSPLYNAIEKCKNPPSGIREFWMHEMHKLNFGLIQSTNNIKPDHLKDISLVLSMKCVGVCVEEYGHDTLNELAFDIKIIAEDKNKKKFINSWHLDCHIIEDGDGEPDHSHPLFHFQHGGRSILSVYEDDEYDFGSSLFLESPRIAFPPMDIPLGINFVLSQFYSDKWRELKRDRTYLRIIKDSQIRLWKPYFSKLTSYFDTPQHNEPAKILMPDLI